MGISLGEGHLALLEAARCSGHGRAWRPHHHCLYLGQVDIATLSLGIRYPRP